MDGLWINKVISIRISITNSHVLCFDFFIYLFMNIGIGVNRLHHVSELCLVNILTFST